MAELTASFAQAFLHIGASDSHVTVVGTGDDSRIVRLTLGYAGVPATLFAGDIPTGLELENAIAAVEDEVMPAVRHLGGAAELVTTDPELRALVEAASDDAGGELPLERVEWLFGELSRVALGGPATGLPFPPTKRAAVALLIVRELMHHGGFRVLRCADRDAAHSHRA